MCQSNLKIIITTSRNPSSSLLRFTKELKKIFPLSLRVNRGNRFLKSLISFCLTENATDLLLVYENRGNPSSLIISHLPSGPTVFFRLSNIIVNKIGKNEHIPRNFPLIVIENLNSPLGKRLSSIIRNLFPTPCTNSKNVVIFSGKYNVVSCKNYWFERKGNLKSDILIHQFSPSFDLFPYKITLGILFEKKTEVEWSMNSFTNTFKKKSFF
uniref:Brix domain-containing protein n=1 Tax=Cryptomonas curvata TaxID=233186 RepID=A0A7S0LXY5_9CRYP|nr:U3 snoRNP protein, IMP4 [Cryptomonas curvata]|mmetsp:Transcript_11636/g.24994  ORF Transcript_11636/g.24994 Transcript_11636/m.24994 type:complete len:212 (+) Transcript_11636:13-648(+)